MIQLELVDIQVLFCPKKSTQNETKQSLQLKNSILTRFKLKVS